MNALVIILVKENVLIDVQKDVLASATIPVDQRVMRNVEELVIHRAKILVKSQYV